MTDIFSSSKRSEIMGRVRSSGNKSTEIKMIQVFKELGIIGWRRNYKVKGHPDFVFLDKKIAVFVDGCFWHGHDCRKTRPKSNSEYWENKIKKNIERDTYVTSLFEDRGWKVVRIWECELRKKNRSILLEKISPIINK